MNDDLANQSTPQSGDASVDGLSPAVKNVSRRKSASPRELYELIYEVRISREDSLNLRIGPPSEVPPQVVGYLKRRMKGAAARITTLKKRMAAYRQSIRNREERRVG